MIYRLDVHVGFEVNYRSICYSNHFLLVWSCDEERGWSCFEKGIIFEVEGQLRRGGQRGHG